MSDSRTILANTVTRLFSNINETGTCNWQQLEDLGLPSLMLDEDSGGFNGQWQDAVLVARLLGHYAIAQPLVETIIGRFSLHRAGHGDTLGPLSIAHCNTATIVQQQHNLISATLRNIPWGRNIPVVITGEFQSRQFVALLYPNECTHRRDHTTIANEPRTDLVLESTPLQALYWVDHQINQYYVAALLRSAQIAGALDKLVEMSARYTSERKQFGRPISKFQVIQHEIAQLAEQTAAVICSSEAAARALDAEGFDNCLFEIAATKLRANMAIPKATSVAHQVHGAIGFTEEHQLHQYTRRLFAWRSEYGNDRFWGNILGNLCVEQQALWQTITARSDRQMKTNTMHTTAHAN